MFEFWRLLQAMGKQSEFDWILFVYICILSSCYHYSIIFVLSLYSIIYMIYYAIYRVIYSVKKVTLLAAKVFKIKFHLDNI